MPDVNRYQKMARTPGKIIALYLAAIGKERSKEACSFFVPICEEFYAQNLGKTYIGIVKAKSFFNCHINKYDKTERGKYVQASE